jgi:hypothetical protein
MVLGAVALATGGPSMVTSSAMAQSWLPWTTREEPPPRRRPPPVRQAPPNYGQFRAPGTNQGNAQPGHAFGNRGPICLQLEQRLAQDAQRKAGSQGTTQKLRADLKVQRRSQRRAEVQLDRRECYETFLFTRSIRPSRVCRKLDRESRSAAYRIQELESQLQQFNSGAGHSQQDEIIRALARNNCGATYKQEARRRDPFQSFWQDNDNDGRRGTGNLFGGLPFATYRTVCVRLCDGYYFPVSFSTLPPHFERDVNVCQSKCAAPTELYFHQNPGGSVDQMVSQRNQQPYTSLRTAFRYRKEFVQGCSCKQAEYVPQDGTATISQAPTKPWATNQTDKLSPVR